MKSSNLILGRSFSFLYSTLSSSELFTNKRMISGSSFLPSLSTLWRKCRPKNDQKDRDRKKRKEPGQNIRRNWPKQWRHEEATSAHALRGQPGPATHHTPCGKPPLITHPATPCVSAGGEPEAGVKRSWWDWQTQSQLRSKGGSSRFPELSYLIAQMCPRSTK